MKSRVAHRTLLTSGGSRRCARVGGIAHDLSERGVRGGVRVVEMCYGCDGRENACTALENGVGGVGLTSSSARTCALLNVPPTMTRGEFVACRDVNA